VTNPIATCSPAASAAAVEVFSTGFNLLNPDLATAFGANPVGEAFWCFLDATRVEEGALR
jgi:hypothetical protein